MRAFTLGLIIAALSATVVGCGASRECSGEECDPEATGPYKRCNADSQCLDGQTCWAGYCTTTCIGNTSPRAAGAECPLIPDAAEPYCYTNKCILPCDSVRDCPEGLDQCDNSATLGYGANGTSCSSTALADL